jgi:hypothetical protein
MKSVKRDAIHSNKTEIEIYLGLIIPLKVDLEETFVLFQDLLSDLPKLKINFPIEPNLMQL